MDLDEMTKIVDEATPGRWDYRRALGCKSVGPRINRQTIREVASTPGLADETEDAANARFIATFSPERVSALLAVARAAEEVLRSIPNSHEESLAEDTLAEALSRLRGEET